MSLLYWLLSVACCVSWATKKQLVNMAGMSGQREYGCEYRGKLYFPAGPEEQAAFLKDPEKFLSQSFPSSDRLPVRLLPTELATCGGKLGLRGYCPVTLLEVCVCDADQPHDVCC